jgi:hypothetical protein
VLDTKDGSTCRRYGIQSFLTYVLIDPNGNVVLTSQHERTLMGSELLTTLRRFFFKRSSEELQ